MAIISGIGIGCSLILATILLAYPLQVNASLWQRGTAGEVVGAEPSRDVNRVIECLISFQISRFEEEMGYRNNQGQERMASNQDSGGQALKE